MLPYSKPMFGEVVITFIGIGCFVHSILTHDSGYAVAGAVLCAASAGIEAARRLLHND